MNHLFGRCSFFRLILEGLGRYYHLGIIWDRELLSHWCSKVKHLNCIPLFLLWECWKVRNKVLFEDERCYPLVVVARIVGDYSTWLNPIQVKKSRIIQQPSYMLDCPIGFFYGIA